MATRQARQAPSRRGSTAARRDDTVVRTSYAGAEGMRQMEADAERREEMQRLREMTPLQPYRYFVGVGDTKQYAIVDHEPTFFRYEHSLRNPDSNRYDLYLPCVKEVADCPVCAAHPDSFPAFVMYLTIIDLEGYVTNAGEEVEWSKKLLVVKPRQAKKFARMLAREGSLRGAIIETTRDAKTDASIGGEFELLEFMDEDELLTYERSYIDKDKNEQWIIGHEPYNYDEIMPDMSLATLESLAGGKPPMGSRRDNARVMGRDSGRRGAREESHDEDPPARGGRRQGTQAAPRGRSEEQYDDDQPARSRPARGARQPAPDHDEDPPARSAPVRGRRQAAQPEHDDQHDDGQDDQQDDPPARTSRAPAAAQRGRRAAPQREPEEAPPANDRPVRGMRTRPPAQRQPADNIPELDDDIPF